MFQGIYKKKKNTVSIDKWKFFARKRFIKSVFLPDSYLEYEKQAKYIDKMTQRCPISSL